MPPGESGKILLNTGVGYQSSTLCHTFYSAELADLSSFRYRLFADLSVISAKAGFRLPSTLPPPTPLPNPNARSNQNAIQPGLIPPNVLQHSGYYFYMAGVCAAKRRDRFKAVKEGLVRLDWPILREVITDKFASRRIRAYH